MSDRFVLEAEPHEMTWVEEDAANNRVVFHRVFDSEPVLDEIRDIKSVTDGRSETGELYHVGRLPMGVVELYCNTRGITFHEFMGDKAHIRALLCDSDYKGLRIWEGRL